MKKNILVYGLISGILVSILMLSSVNYLSHCAGNADYATSMLIGYASMVLSLSLVFVGVRNYRDKYNGGVISFGKAFQVGILMVLVGSTVYAVAWVIDYFYFIPDFMEKYAAYALGKLKEAGASQAVIAAQTTEMADMVRKCKNPFYSAMIAYSEILPVGLIVTLISSLILKRKQA